MTRKASAPLLTRRDLAARLGIHMMTVTKWERGGLPIARRGRRGKPSKYREVDVRAWLQQRDEAAKDATAAVDAVAERARKDRARAVLDEQTYLVRARELIPRDEVERLWLAEVTAVRTALLAWPMTQADRIFRTATLEGLPGLERLLTELMHQVLKELADPKPPTPAQSSRTTRHAHDSRRRPAECPAPVAATA